MNTSYDYEKWEQYLTASLFVFWKNLDKSKLRWNMAIIFDIWISKNSKYFKKTNQD